MTRTSTIAIKGVEFEVEYFTQPSDPNVGLDSYTETRSIFYEKVDFTEILEDYIPDLEDEIQRGYERLMRGKG